MPKKGRAKGNCLIFAAAFLPVAFIERDQAHYNRYTMYVVQKISICYQEISRYRGTWRWTSYSKVISGFQSVEMGLFANSLFLGANTLFPAANNLFPVANNLFPVA